MSEKEVYGDVDIRFVLPMGKMGINSEDFRTWLSNVQQNFRKDGQPTPFRIQVDGVRNEIFVDLD